MPQVRLDKYLADMGIASRKELRAVIRSGRAAVDGVTVTAEYIGSTVYVSAGNIHVSGTGSEIKDLVAWAGKLAGANDAAAAGNAYAQFFRELTPPPSRPTG